MSTARRPALLAAVALITVAAAPALPSADTAESAAPDGCRQAAVTAQDGNEHGVTLCESQQFIAAGTTPLSNATNAVFTADEPTAPVGGAGVGGSLTDIAAQGDPAHGLEVQGTFTGPLDTLDVEVFVAMPNASGGSHGVTPQLEVDGFNFGGQLIDATVTPADNGLAVVSFRIEDMLALWPLLQYETGPDIEHTLRLNLSPFYFGDDGAYLYGGTEAPSNVVLNAAG